MMSLSYLIAAAKQESSQYKPSKCCILTRSGGCRKEASKYKFQNLISKFELYNVEPPALKDGYDAETSRVCREHHKLSPRKYQEDERPTGNSKNTSEYLVKDDGIELDENESTTGDSSVDSISGVDSSESGDEWEEESAEDSNNHNNVQQRAIVVVPEQPIQARSARRGKQLSPREQKEKDPSTPPQVQERHCIYLKVDDDEKCRAVAQKLGLARGPNGYNRSALLAKVPQVVSENIKLKDQIVCLQDRVHNLEQQVSRSLPGTPPPPLITASEAQYYEDMNAKLSTLKETRSSANQHSWVNLLVNNLTEDEILKVVAMYGGNLKRRLCEVLSGEEPEDSVCEVPNNPIFFDNPTTNYNNNNSLPTSRTTTRKLTITLPQPHQQPQQHYITAEEDGIKQTNRKRKKLC